MTADELDRVLAAADRRPANERALVHVLATAAPGISEVVGADVTSFGREVDVLDAPRVRLGWLLELVARLQVRYPAVPLVFADSRKLAEESTYRFLAAALAQHVPAHERDGQPPA